VVEEGTGKGPTGDRAGGEDAGSRKGRLGGAAGIGTLLAGIAAIGALVVSVIGSDDTTSAPQTPPPPAAATSVKGDSEPALATARGFGDLSTIVGQLADDRLEPDREAPYTSFRTITADDGEVSIDAPIAWKDIETTAWLDDRDRPLGAAVIAAENVDDLYEPSNTPGIFLGASPSTVNPSRLLDAREARRKRHCAHEGSGQFDGDGFEGGYALWSQCDDDDTLVLDLAANRKSGPGTAIIYLRIGSAADLDAASRVLQSVRIDLESVIDRIGYKAPGFLLD